MYTQKDRRDKRKLGELRVGSVPDFNGVDIGIDDVFKVCCESGAVDGWAASCDADALGDVEDDACEAVFVEVDFLVVGDLADCAGFIS